MSDSNLSVLLPFILTQSCTFFNLQEIKFPCYRSSFKERLVKIRQILDVRTFVHNQLIFNKADLDYC